METEKGHITIIEDDENVRELYAYVLEQSGYTVDGFATVEAFEKGLKRSDLFVIDIQLPDGNGLQVCEKLKDSEEFGKIPVIIISANIHAIEKTSSRADLFLPKPFDIHYLVETAGNMVRGFLPLKRADRPIHKTHGNPQLSAGLDLR